MRFAILIFVAFSFACQAQSDTLIPVKNKEIVEYCIKNGRKISPTYNSAVCTEFVIGVLKHFTKLSDLEKKRIRIITEEDVFTLIKNNDSIPKGVYFALISSGKGSPVSDLKQVKKGDFVQFWYEGWGHCGIVDSIDIENKTMNLHSSFPSTEGYGVQTFDIPDFCFFVRLN